MSGDLGNLLTGELGEAEARFSHEDFAALYGRRIAGRVRRRRAVRAAGVGGGTMLTAGALVVGVTQVPWGTLGATPGVGASDCVTPSATDGWQAHSASVDTGEATSGELVITDFGNDTMILRGVQQPDGTFLFTDAQGSPLSSTPGVGGYYTVELPPGAYYDSVTRSISLEPGGTGSASSQQATSTQSEGGLEYWVSIDTDQGSLASLSILYAATGGVIVDGVRQPDGTYLFTDGYGAALAATPESSGLYTVALPSGVTSLESTSTMAYRSDAVSTNYLSVYPPTVVRFSDSTPSPTGDCYTPSPTPSSSPNLSIDYTYTVEPSLAAKPEEIEGSPFQCGFEFPTESYGTDDLWIDDARWITGAETLEAFQARYGDDPAQLPIVDTPAGPVAVVATHFASTMTGRSAAITWGTASPTVADIDTELGRNDAMVRSSAGATYVGVADGRVVATGTLPPTVSWTTPPVFLDYVGEEGRSSLYLLDEGAALTSCDANPVDVASIDLVAVAGVVVKQPDGTVAGPTYAWAPIGKP